MIDFNHDDDSVTNTGQAIAAINIAAFGDVAVFKKSVDTLVRDFRNSERMPGVDRILVPGERSFETRAKRTRDGIPLAPALMRGLDRRCRRSRDRKAGLRRVGPRLPLKLTIFTVSRAAPIWHDFAISGSSYRLDNFG